MAQWKQIEDKPELSSPDVESQSMGLVNPSIKCTRAVGSRDSPEGSVPYPRPVHEPMIRTGKQSLGLASLVSKCWRSATRKVGVLRVTHFSLEAPEVDSVIYL